MIDQQMACLIGKAIDAAITLNNRNLVVDHINQQAAAGKSYEEISASLDQMMDDAIAAAQKSIDNAK